MTLQPPTQGSRDPREEKPTQFCKNPEGKYRPSLPPAKKASISLKGGKRGKGERKASSETDEGERHASARTAPRTWASQKKDTHEKEKILLVSRYGQRSQSRNPKEPQRLKRAVSLSHAVGDTLSQKIFSPPKGLNHLGGEVDRKPWIEEGLHETYSHSASYKDPRKRT